ncbi:hypothetical protein MTBUT4_220058 [Magnetospirillum sp. UT-4]|nr:hypothetical protein MTBUT4_220058 [Magnetospirillum sp. UT-4]
MPPSIRSIWRPWPATGSCRESRPRRDSIPLAAVLRRPPGVDPGAGHPLPAAAAGPPRRRHRRRQGLGAGRVRPAEDSVRAVVAGAGHAAGRGRPGRLEAPVDAGDLRLPADPVRPGGDPEEGAAAHSHLRLVPGQDRSDRHRPRRRHPGAEGHGQGRRRGRRRGPPGADLPRGPPHGRGRGPRLPQRRGHAVRGLGGGLRAGGAEHRHVLGPRQPGQAPRHRHHRIPRADPPGTGPQGLHGRAAAPHRGGQRPPGRRGAGGLTRRTLVLPSPVDSFVDFALGR